MPIEYKLKQHFVIYGDFSQIQATTDRIRLYIDAFPSYLPTVIDEINLGIGASTPGAPPVPRLRLVNGASNFSVTILPSRIDFECAFLPPTGNNVPDGPGFIEVLEPILMGLFRLEALRVNRIAYLFAGLLDYVDTVQIRQIYERIFVHNDGPNLNAFEWGTRRVVREVYNINERNENCNAIFNVSRVQGHVPNCPVLANFDRIQVEFDFNTVFENKEYRFDENSARQLVNASVGFSENCLRFLEL